MIVGPNVLRIPLKNVKRSVLRAIDKLIVCDSALLKLDDSEWFIAETPLVFLKEMPS
jgi:hypothetical protein